MQKDLKRAEKEEAEELKNSLKKLFDDDYDKNSSKGETSAGRT